MEFQKRVQAFITELYSGCLDDVSFYSNMTNKFVKLAMEDMNVTIDYVRNIATPDELMKISEFMSDIFDVEINRNLYDAFVYRYNNINDEHFKKIVGVDINWCKSYFDQK